MPTVVSFWGSVLIAIEMVIGTHILLTPRFPKLPTYLLLSLGIIIYNTAYFFPYLSPIRTILPMVGMLVVVLIAYKDKWIHTVFTYLAVVIIEAVVEFINVFVQPKGVLADWPNSASIQHQIIAYMLFTFSFGVLLTIFVLIVQRIRRNSTKYIGTREAVIFSVLLMIELIILALISKIACENLSTKLFVLLLAITLAFTIADFAVFFSVVSTARRQAESARADMLEQMVQAQGEYYAALTEQQESIRAMRHDIANHIFTMKLLLEEHKDAAVSEYLDDLQEKYRSHSKLGACLNPVVDAFLYNRIQSAEAEGINVKSEIAIPADLSISNTDLIGLFANIMDNAIETCAEIENAEISIKAHILKGYLIVNEENPLPEFPAKKERRIPELERGIGFRILEDLAHRYDGKFEHQKSDGKFKVSVMLKDILPT